MVRFGSDLEERKAMKRTRHTSEQIIQKLREAEIRLQKGQDVPQVCRAIGVTPQTYYRCRKEYGGMRADHAKWLKALEKENARLKKLVADQALGMAILKDVASGNF
jgi:transposase-like protein